MDHTAKGAGWTPSGATPRNLAQLTAPVKTRLRRMQYRPGLFDGFLASTGLDLTPFCNPTITPPLEIFSADFQVTHRSLARDRRERWRTEDTIERLCDHMLEIDHGYR